MSTHRKASKDKTVNLLKDLGSFKKKLGRFKDKTRYLTAKDKFEKDHLLDFAREKFKKIFYIACNNFLLFKL